MKRSEQVWVGLMNSPRVRALRRSRPVRRLLGSKLIDRADRRRRRWIAGQAARRDPGLFDELDVVCLLIGHVKSGGSLISALVDAHPDAVMADEVDVLDHLERGFSRDELLHVLVRNARRETLKGRMTARRLGGYSLAVPGQWQGTHRVVRAIGESRAGPTTRRLGEDRGRLTQLRRFAHPAALRFIHVVRNPLDPIGAMVKRGGRSVEQACDDYAAQANRLDRIRSWLGGDELLTLHYDEVVAHPGPTLAGVLEYLGLDPDPHYLSACAALVDGNRRRERRYVDWSPADLDRVRHLVASHDFLARYGREIEMPTGSVGS